MQVAGTSSPLPIALTDWVCGQEEDPAGLDFGLDESDREEGGAETRGNL
jgi:hypothetical protein